MRFQERVGQIIYLKHFWGGQSVPPSPATSVNDYRFNESCFNESWFNEIPDFFFKKYIVILIKLFFNRFIWAIAIEDRGQDRFGTIGLKSGGKWRKNFQKRTLNFFALFFPFLAHSFFLGSLSHSFWWNWRNFKKVIICCNFEYFSLTHLVY